MQKTIFFLLLLIMLPGTCLAGDNFYFNADDFGKSRTEIKAQERGLLNAEDTIGLSYRIPVAFGMQTHKYYDFTPKDKLASIAYEMLPAADNPTEAFEKYEKIKAYITRIYGDPAVFEEVNDNEAFETANPASRNADLLSGDLCLWTQWETENLELVFFMESIAQETLIRLNIKHKALFTEM